MTRLVILHDFHDRRYHPGAEVPYAFSSARFRDEVQRRAPELEVVAAATADETAALLPAAEILAASQLSPAQLAAAERLRWVHISASGADHFFRRSNLTARDFSDRGIMITTSRGAGTVVLAEQVLCYMLMFSRTMLQAVRQHDRGEWRRYAGGELSGSTLGIIGFGAIGQRVAHLAGALGMDVIATRRNPGPAEGTARILPATENDAVFAAADFLLLSCPITEATRDIANARSLSLMKPTAYLMNIARGECIDEPALVAALQNGTIAGYASDNHGKPTGPVTDETMERLADDSPLWRLPNVIVTPNSAVAGPRRYEYMAGIFADNFHAWRAGTPMPTLLG